MARFKSNLHPRGRNGKFIQKHGKLKKAAAVGTTVLGATAGAVIGSALGSVPGSIGGAISGGRAGAAIGNHIKSAKVRR